MLSAIGGDMMLILLINTQHENYLQRGRRGLWKTAPGMAANPGSVFPCLSSSVSLLQSVRA